MTTPELPPLHWVGAMQIDNASFQSLATEASVEARERILLARIAEQDHVIAIARQNAELLTGYWKAAVAEVKALRAEMKAHGIPPEGDDDVDGW